MSWAGARTEVTAATTTVALESAWFDPTVVARTVRRHGLASEASRRYERGVDPALARPAAEVAARMMLGDAYPGAGALVTEVGEVAVLPAVVLPAGECDRLGGRVYPAATITTRLEQVGCIVVAEADQFIVQPPSWRPDLTRAADLVEEVLRLEGFGTIPVTLPRAPAARGLRGPQRARRRATAALVDAGYAEVLLLPFVAQDVTDRLGLDADDERRRSLRVANPLSEAEAYLRTTLLPGLIAAAGRNVGRGNPDVALFELGAVFVARTEAQGWVVPPVPPVTRRPTGDELIALEMALPHQPTHAAVVLTGDRVPAGPLAAARPADWADAVEAARVLAAAVGTPLTVSAGAKAPWHPGRCAELSIGTGASHRVIGYAGELHPRVVGAADLPGRACAMELDLGALIAAAEPAPVLAPLSPYPPADRDVALLVPAQVSAAAVEAALVEGAGADLESVRVFDDFTTGRGQRSLAYRMRWRADRTLTAEEVNGLRDTAVALATERTGAELRR